MSRIYGAPFATVPEWLLDSSCSDRAIRLWAVLDRYADAEGRAFPGRPRLAERLGCGVSSVDRALAELVEAEAVATQAHYRSDGSRAANSYWLWPAHPPVPGGLPTPGEGVAPPVGPPLPTQHAAGSNESQGTDNQVEPTPELGAPPPTTQAAVLAAGFDRFWTAYPRATAKGQARAAWPAAVKAAGGIEAVVAGAQRYRDDPNRDDRFTKHPATWLRAECWADPPLPARTDRPKRATVGGVDADRTAPAGRVEL